MEYVGELVRKSVADLRERAYAAQGLQGLYLFSLGPGEGDGVVDATRKGGISRFINHCCECVSLWVWNYGL